MSCLYTKIINLKLIEGEKYEDEDGTGQVEIFEVGRLYMDAIILRVIGDKVYEIEDLPEDEDIDY